MYGSKTLLGNYHEDRTHAELLAKDYQLKKQRGELLTLKQQRQESIMMQTVSRVARSQNPLLMASLARAVVQRQSASASAQNVLDFSLHAGASFIFV